jgi:hypothetical protein
LAMPGLESRTSANNICVQIVKAFNVRNHIRKEPKSWPNSVCCLLSVWSLIKMSTDQGLVRVLFINRVQIQGLVRVRYQSDSWKVMPVNKKNCWRSKPTKKFIELICGYLSLSHTSVDRALHNLHNPYITIMCTI